MRFLSLGGGAWLWPAWGSALETRSARRDKGRSLNISTMGVEAEMGGSRAFFEQAVV